jgi:quinol monooxygenase YgiN
MSEANTMQTSSFTAKDLNDGFVVAINIEAKAEESDTVAAILEEMVEPTMAEPGVKLFLPYRSPASPSSFFIFELYVDEAGWGAHQETPHFKRAIAALLPRMTKRERVPFIPYVGVGR